MKFLPGQTLMDTLVLGNSHSLIVTGYKEKANFKEAAEALLPRLEVENFGLFSSAAGISQYYPEVTQEDFTPKDEDFVYPTYRLLSETIVNKGSWRPVSFEKPNVLKSSMNMLKGQTIYLDHEDSTSNAIGAIVEVFWQGAKKLPNGNIIPAGINGVFKIDAKSNPRIARGVMMDPPSLHSNSVTLQFKWEPSHPEMDQEEFYEKMGTYDKDGKLVCRVATTVLAYHETSLVSNGADIFAKKIGKDGTIIDADKASSVYQSLKYSGWNNWKSQDPSASIISFKREDPTPPIPGVTEEKPINNQNNNSMKELFTLMLAMGITDALTEDNALSILEAHVNKLKKDNEEALATLTTQLTAREAEINTLKADLAKNANLAKVGESYLASAKTQAINHYKLTRAESDVDPNVISTIEGFSTPESIEAFAKIYQQEFDKSVPLTCKKCGSTEVDRLSSKKDQGGNTKPGSLSNEDAAKILLKSK